MNNVLIVLVNVLSKVHNLLTFRTYFNAFQITRKLLNEFSSIYMSHLKIIIIYLTIDDDMRWSSHHKIFLFSIDINNI